MISAEMQLYEKMNKKFITIKYNNEINYIKIRSFQIIK
jgi:hypothetical protein